MQSLVKNVFVIIGTMMVSILLVTLVLGNTGRFIIWRGIEPVFQNNWNMVTLDDGRLVDSARSSTFGQLTEVKH